MSIKEGLKKFTYADVVRLTRPDGELGTQSTQLGTQSTQDTQATLGTQQSEAAGLLTMPRNRAATVSEGRTRAA